MLDWIRQKLPILVLALVVGTVLFEVAGRFAPSPRTPEYHQWVTLRPCLRCKAIEFFDGQRGPHYVYSGFAGGGYNCR